MDRRKVTRIGRWLGGVLLLVCLVLPVSQCEKQRVVIENGKLESRSETPSTYKVLYPTDYIDLSDIGGVVALVSYTWPVLAALAYFATRRRNARRFVSFFEALLCIGSGWVIYELGSIGRRMIGGYVGLVAVTIYCLATLPDCWTVLRELKAKVWSRRFPQDRPEAADR
jgi:hypothetical protein